MATEEVRANRWLPPSRGGNKMFQCRMQHISSPAEEYRGILVFPLRVKTQHLATLNNYNGADWWGPHRAPRTRAKKYRKPIGLTRHDGTGKCQIVKSTIYSFNILNTLNETKPLGNTIQQWLTSIWNNSLDLKSSAKKYLWQIYRSRSFKLGTTKW